MNLNEAPIVRLELEHMKHSILHAFISHSSDMQKAVEASIDRYCSSENLQLEIDKIVASVINSCIQRDVDSFFRYGEGRAVVAKAVIDRLKLEFGIIER